MRSSEYRPIILILDDEEGMRSIYKAKFSMHKCVPLILSDPETAQLLIQRFPKIDLLITDGDLGQKRNGVDVAISFRKRFPDSPILMVTGDGPESDRVRALRQIPNAQYLQKPYSNEVLNKLIYPVLHPGESIGEPCNLEKLKSDL